jgi:hypothetical protein
MYLSGLFFDHVLDLTNFPPRVVDLPEIAPLTTVSNLELAAGRISFNAMTFDSSHLREPSQVESSESLFDQWKGHLEFGYDFVKVCPLLSRDH